MLVWNNKFLQKEEIMSNILSQKTIHMQVTRVECRKKNEVSQHNYLYLHNILWFFNEKKKNLTKKKSNHHDKWRNRSVHIRKVPAPQNAVQMKDFDTAP